LSGNSGRQSRTKTFVEKNSLASQEDTKAHIEPKIYIPHHDVSKLNILNGVAVEEKAEPKLDTLVAEGKIEKVPEQPAKQDEIAIKKKQWVKHPVETCHEKYPGRHFLSS